MKRTAVVVLMVLWFCPAWSQDKMDFYTDAFNVLRDDMLPRLIDRLPRGDRQKLTNIDLALIPNPAVVTAVFTENNTKRIYISLGFMDGVFQYVDCLLMKWNGIEGEECYEYFDYYFDKIVLRSPDPPVSVAEFVLKDDSQIDAWYRNKRISRMRKTLYLSAFINIIMHEMGHHIVGFAERGMSVTKHRELETRVDRWAIDRLASMNENPVLGAVVAFGYISQMERFRRIKGATGFSLHPTPRSRVQYAYTKGCANLTSELASKACEMLADLIVTFE